MCAISVETTSQRLPALFCPHTLSQKPGIRLLRRRLDGHTARPECDRAATWGGTGVQRDRSKAVGRDLDRNPEISNRVFRLLCRLLCWVLRLACTLLNARCVIFQPLTHSTKTSLVCVTGSLAEAQSQQQPERHSQYLSEGDNHASQREVLSGESELVYSQVRPAVPRRARRCSTDLVWIWLTLLSVTPRTSPISDRVKLSS